MEIKSNIEIQIQQINDDVLSKVSSLKKRGTVETLIAAQSIYEDMVSDKLRSVSKGKIPNLLKLRKRNFLIFFAIHLIFFGDVFWGLNSIMDVTDSYLSMYWIVFYIYLFIGLYILWFCYFKNPLNQLKKALKVASKKLKNMS